MNTKIFYKYGVWLAWQQAASQSEAMLENPMWRTSDSCQEGDALFSASLGMTALFEEVHNDENHRQDQHDQCAHHEGPHNLRGTYRGRERKRLSLSAFLVREDIGVHIVHISRVIITYTLE